MRISNRFQKILIPNHHNRVNLMGGIDCMYAPYMDFMDNSGFRREEEETLIHELSHVAEHLTPLSEIIDEFSFTIAPAPTQSDSLGPIAYQQRSYGHRAHNAVDLIDLFESKYEYVQNKDRLYESIMGCTPTHWLPVTIFEFNEKFFSSNIHTLFRRELLKQSALMGMQIDISHPRSTLSIINRIRGFSLKGKLKEEFLIEAIEKFTRYSHPVFRSLMALMYLDFVFINENIDLEFYDELRML